MTEIGTELGLWPLGNSTGFTCSLKEGEDTSVNQEGIVCTYYFHYLALQQERVGQIETEQH